MAKPAHHGTNEISGRMCEKAAFDHLSRSEMH